MEYEPINLTHKKLLEDRLKRIGTEISEYTFANLYLFRAIHQYQLVFNRDIYIKGVSRDNVAYLMPTSPIDNLNLNDLQESMIGCEYLFPIPEQWRTLFLPEKFECSFLEQDSDYLYEVEKMKTYPGRKLSGRRNLLKQFMDHYPNHFSEPINSKNMDSALQILENWHLTSLHAKNSDYTECKEALLLLDKLNLNGRITFIDGQGCGFLLGEELNTTTYVIHFAKGDIQYKGIYQYLYQEFANNLGSQYIMINLEQDLGAEELRHAKRAYMPDHLVPKLRVRVKL